MLKLWYVKLPGLLCACKSTDGDVMVRAATAVLKHAPLPSLCMLLCCIAMHEVSLPGMLQARMQHLIQQRDAAQKAAREAQRATTSSDAPQVSVTAPAPIAR